MQGCPSAGAYGPSVDELRTHRFVSAHRAILRSDEPGGLLGPAGGRVTCRNLMGTRTSVLLKSSFWSASCDDSAR